MPLFRKKPVVVEAIRYTKANESRVLNFAGRHARLDKYPPIKGQNRLLISTLEGTMSCDYGGWVVKGIHGEFYPCKSDIFDAIYEKV